MSIAWRCPACSQVSREDDVNVSGLPLACDHCERPILPHESLCTVCDTPNPWHRRDTLHYVCLECGNSQTFYSHLVSSRSPADDEKAGESAA